MSIKVIKLFLILFFFLKLQCVIAGELRYEFGYEVESATNIALVPESSMTDDASEKFQTSFLNIFYTEDSANVRADVSSALRYVDYENNVFSDESINSLDAEVLWSISPNRLSWLFHNRYTQTALDALELQNVTNRQNVNEFISGPNVHWQLGKLDSLDLTGRVQSYEYDENSSNNERLLTSVSWTKNLEPSLQFIINYEILVVDFHDESVNDNFNRNNYNIGLDYTRGINHAVVLFGGTEIKSSNGVSSSNETKSFTYSRNISSRSELNLSYVESVSDSSEVAVEGQTGITSNFTEKDQSFMYHKILRTSEITVEYHDIERQGIFESLLENEIRTVIEINKTLGALSRLNLKFESQKIGFIDNNTMLFSDKISTSEFEFERRMSRRLTFTAGYEYLTRESADVNRNLSDKRVSFGITYRSI